MGIAALIMLFGINIPFHLIFIGDLFPFSNVSYSSLNFITHDKITIVLNSVLFIVQAFMKVPYFFIMGMIVAEALYFIKVPVFYYSYDIFQRALIYWGLWVPLSRIFK